MLLHQLVRNFTSKYTQKWFMIIKLRALLVKQQTILNILFYQYPKFGARFSETTICFVTIKSPICGKWK